ECNPTTHERQNQSLPQSLDALMLDPVAIEQLETGRDWIRYAASCLAGADLAYGQGSEDSLEEAERLVGAVLHWDPHWSDDLMRCRILPGERKAIAALIERRIRERRPLAYLVRESYFFGFAPLCG
ncbi:N5-glutamine S-adenosyl-L-methionine-dependent methyltransferase, partial [mine drainage metagenome]